MLGFEANFNDIFAEILNEKSVCIMKLICEGQVYIALVNVNVVVFLPLIGIFYLGA